LVLLRSDLQSLYGPEGAVGGPVTTPRLAALGICAGLELLAKYWAGNPDVRQRAVLGFLTAVGDLSQSDAETLLQFRNSLAHGYGLATRRRSDQKAFSFSVDTGNTAAPTVVSNRGSGIYLVNLWSLKRLFLTAIRGCRRELGRDDTRLGKFQVCIRNLGEIAIEA
jgi:hypothetical protein